MSTFYLLLFITRLRYIFCICQSLLLNIHFACERLDPQPLVFIYRSVCSPRLRTATASLRRQQPHRNETTANMPPSSFIVVICWFCWFSPVYGKIHQITEMFAYIVSVIERWLLVILRWELLRLQFVALVTEWCPCDFLSRLVLT